MIQSGYLATTDDVRGVDVVHWNPRYRFTIAGKTIANLRRRTDNFGDLLGPLLADRLAPRDALSRRKDRPRMLAVGSILHFAEDGDTVWGTGVNGKINPARHRFTDLDVRAVRGPRTREFLQERGIDAPDVYGDPALLLPEALPSLSVAAGQKKYGRTIVPNLNDIDGWQGHPDVLDPRSPLLECLERIVRSEQVVGTSLHAMIVAESFGVDFVRLREQAESPFKFQDYVEGTGRELVPAAADLDAVSSAPRNEPLKHDTDALLAAFPTDLWQEAS